MTAALEVTFLFAPAAKTTGQFQQRLLSTSAAVKDAPQVPDFSHYEAKSSDTNRAMAYFTIGSMGLLTATVAKQTVTEFLATMAASADVLALAKVEVELASIPEGKNVIIKWRGKPVFIRHRTQDEIDEARNTDWKGLRDPESDESRVKKPEWLVMLGVCTHLGCVPIGEAGDYGGWCVHAISLCHTFTHCALYHAGSAHATVLTTIFVRPFATHVFKSYMLMLPLSWTYPQGPRSRKCALSRRYFSRAHVPLSTLR